MDCIGIGLTTLDLCLVVGEYPGRDTKTVARSEYIGGGGPVANALVTLARLGLNTALVSTVGDDVFGRINLQELKLFGVNTTDVKQLSGIGSLYSQIIVEKGTGNRTVIQNTAEIPPIRLSQVSDGLLQNCRAVIIDSRANPDILEIVKMAKRSGARVMFDGGSVQEYANQILELADYPIVSRQFADDYFGNRDYAQMVQDLLGYGGSVAGITLGVQGAYLATREELVNIPAYQIKAVDTTGAGDLFHGGLLYGLLQEWNVKESGEFASALAALGCMALGARNGIPDLNGVRKFFRQYHMEKHPVFRED